MNIFFKPYDRSNSAPYAMLPRRVGRSILAASIGLLGLVGDVPVWIAGTIQWKSNAAQAQLVGTACPAGTVPVDISAVSGSGFTQPPTNQGSNVPAGSGRLTVPGVTYTMPNGSSFKSQARHQSPGQFNVYPQANSFSIQQGDRNFGFASLNQVAFPGDPANNVPAVNTWFYSNGNWFGTGNYTTAVNNDVNVNGEYLLWQQDVTIPNWSAGKTYVFFSYVTNVIEFPTNDAPDDPIVRLRLGGGDSLPNGTLLAGPTILKESSTSTLPAAGTAFGVNTSNTAPLGGWHRISAAIQPTSNTVRLKFTSSATGQGGDDFGLTQINLYECQPVGVNVSGTLYEDADGGNDLDPSEPKLPANVTVRLLDTNNNVIQTTVTDASGNYTFTGVSNGSYRIRVDTTDTDIPSGYTLGTPNDLAVTVAGSAIPNQNFGFDKPLSNAGLPFQCDARFYQIRAVANLYSELFLIDRRTNPYSQTQIGNLPDVAMNGMAFNPVDNYLYAMYLGPNASNPTGVSATQGLYRIGQSGAENLGGITGLPAGFQPTAADFDRNGNYYVTRAGGSNELYKINVATNTATLVTMSQATPNLGDMSLNPLDGLLYGVAGTTLYIINPNTGAVTTRTMSQNGSWGTTFFDPAGTFYVYDNNGPFVTVNLTTGEVIPVSSGPTATRSDGGVCSYPPQRLDTVKSAGTVTRVNATTFDVPYTIVIKNTGTTLAPNVQITENLGLAFNTGNPTFTIQGTPTVSGGALTLNPGFNGTTNTSLLSGNDSLAVGEQRTVSFTVRVAYPDAASVPTTAANRVYASSISTPGNPGYTFSGATNTPIPPPDLLASDTSTNGSTPPTTANGDIPSLTSITFPTSPPVPPSLCSAAGGVLGANLFENNGSFGTLPGTPSQTTFGGALPAGRTTYQYTTNTGYANGIDDGQYTIINKPNPTTFRTDGAWHHPYDHTNGSPSTNGLMMLINASFDAGVFYQETLATTPNTNYEFSAWIMNILRNSGIKPNLAFEIDRIGVDDDNNPATADGNEQQVIAISGDILESATPTWLNYGAIVNSGSATQIIVRFRNNAPGGGGNDLALDDLAFTPCILRSGNVSGTLYGDVNASSGFEPATDTRLPAKIGVQLVNNQGQIVAQTETDPNGNYTFTNVPSGSGYTIQVVTTDPDIPTDTTPSAPTQAKLTGVSIPTNSILADQNLGFTVPVANNPNVLLVKRITAVNGSTTTNAGDNLSLYTDEPNNPYDDNVLSNPEPDPIDTDKWLNPTTFLIGGLNGGNVKPNDEIEYTIYFLSAGKETANNVLMCDRVPTNVTFNPTGFNTGFPSDLAGLSTADRGIVVNLGGNILALTGVADGDRARYFPPGIEPSSVPEFDGINCGGANTNGAIVINLGNLPHATAPGTPLNSYGFVRFRGKVK